MAKYLPAWPDDKKPSFDAADEQLYTAHSTSRTLLDGYAVLKREVAAEWKIDPDIPFDQQLQGVALEKARNQLIQGTRALLKQREPFVNRELNNGRRRIAELKMQVMQRGMRRENAGDVRQAFLDILALQNFEGLSPSEKTLKLKDLVEQKAWDRLANIISAPLDVVTLDPRVRAMSEKALFGGVDPEGWAKLQDWSIKTQATAEAWDIARRAVGSDSGLDAVERQEAVSTSSTSGGR